MKHLTKADVKLICEYLGALAVEEAYQGNEKREERIFQLITKLENEALENESEE